MSLQDLSPEVVTRLELQELTAAGVERTLKRMYAKQSQVTDNDITVMLVPDPENVEPYLRKKAQQLVLPFIGFTPIGLAQDNESFNRHVMRKNGYTFARTTDNQTWFVLKGAPVVMTFQCTFITDDYPTLMRIVDMWIATDIWTFDLRIEEVNEKIRLKMIPDAELTYPSKTTDSGSAEQFRFTTTLKVHTYSGYLWRIPSTVNFNLEILVGGQTMEDAFDQRGLVYQTRAVINIVPKEDSMELGAILGPFVPQDLSKYTL